MKQIVKWFACFSLFALPAFAATILSTDFTDFENTGNAYGVGVRTNTATSAAWPYSDVIFKPAGAAAANGIGSLGFTQLKASSGTLQFPAIDNAASLSVIAEVSSGSANLLLQQQNANGWATIGSFPLTANGAVHTHTFTNAGSAAVFRFSAGGKATYIHDLVVTDSTSDTAPVWSSIPMQYVLVDDYYETNLFACVTGATNISLTAASTEDYDFDANGDFLFSSSDMGTYSFTFRADNEAGFSFATVNVTVTDSIPSASDEAPAWSALPTPSVTVGQTYELDLSDYVSGTPAPTITLSTSVSTNDYEFDDGYLMFTPSATGSFSFTFTANNGIGSPASATLTVASTGSAPVVSVPQTSYNATLGGTDVVFYVTATGTPTPTLALSATTASGADYDFDPNDGYFTFTPSATGTYTFTFTATSLAGSNSKTVTVTVTAPVATYSISVASGIQNGSISVNVSEATEGTPVTVTATPAAGYKLEAITVNGTPIEGTTFSMPAANVTVGATFVESTAVTATYTVASKTNVTVTGTVPAGSSATYSTTYSSVYQLTSGHSMTLTLSGYNGATITGLTLSMRSNGSGGGGTLSATCGNATIAGIADSKFNTANWHGSWSTNYVDVTPSVTATTVDGNVVITIAATASSLYCRSFTIEYEPGIPSGNAPAWSSIPVQTVAVGQACDLDLANYVSGTAPIAITMADTEYDAILVGTEFSFTPDTVGSFSFSFTAANDFGSANATLTVTASGTAPVVTVTPATYAYNVTAGDPDVEFTVTASGNPAPVLSGSCTEGAFYLFENNAFLFEPDTAGTYHFVFTATNSVGSDSKTVTVTVAPAAVPAPTLTISNETDTTADASWTAVSGATAYTLQLASDNQFSGGLLAENFSKIAASNSTAVANFDNVTQTAGWSGEYAYPHPGALRMGNSSKAGSLQTPALTASGGITVSWTAWRWDGDTPTVAVGVSEDGGTTFSEQTVALTDTATAYSHTFALSGSSAIVRWRATAASKKRFFLDDISVTSSSGSLISSTTTSSTAYTFTGLDPETIYYARVKADDGEWSSVVDFITDEASGTAPAITAIADQTYVYGSGSGDFELTVTATGDPAPEFSVASSDAPAGSFEIDENTGFFFFTPAATGTFHFTVTASNGVSPAATASFAVTVTGTAPSISAIPDQTKVLGTGDVELTASATGNPAPTYSVASSDAPAGSFDIDDTTGFFFFTPAATGTFHFTVTASNSVSTASRSFTVTVAPASVPAPTLTISNETDTTADASWTAVSGASSYTLQLGSDEHFTPGPGYAEDFTSFPSASSYATNSQTVASGTWAYDGAKFAPGGAANGEGSKGNTTLRANGTLDLPAIDHPSKVSVAARVSSGTGALNLQQYASGSWSTIATWTLSSTGTVFSHTLDGTGSAVALRLTGAKVTTIYDVAVASADGSLLEEITTASTSYTFTGLDPDELYCARVKADDGDWSTTVMFATEEPAGTAPSITAIADQTYVYGATEGIFTLDVTASGTPAPTFSVASADAPEGYFGINPTSGLFEFMPLATGTFHFTVTAANGVSPNATASFAVTVTGTAPSVTPIADKTITLEDGGTEFQIAATGNPPPVFSATSTTAPAGSYGIDASGVFTFIPEAEGTFFFVVTASNSVASSSIAFAITVAPSVAPVPELTVTNIAATSADASWTAITGALSYTLQLGTDYDFAPASGYAEDFSSFASASYSTDLASQTVSSGMWSYENVKMTPGGAANGVGSKGYAQLQASNGHLYLPSIDNPAKLTVVARASGGALTLQQQVGGTWTTIDSFTLEPTGTAHTHTFADAGTSVALRLVAGTSTTYVYDISVVCADGTLVEEVTLPGWTHTFTNLTPSTLYCARVKADNSDWSDVELFETTAPAGTAPTLATVEDQTISLEDGELELTVTATGTPAPTFSVTSTDAPAGSFSIGPASGEFKFTPESEGTYNFTVTAANGVSPDAQVSFAVTVTSSVLPAPVLAVANVTETTAEATWSSVAGASAYTLQLGSDNQFTPGPGYAEDFASFPSASSYVTNSQTVASGTWTYDGAKFTPGGAANGEGSKGYIALRANGTLDLPAIDHPSKVTVVARVNSGTGTLKLQQYASGSWSDIETWTISDSGTAYSHSFANAGTAVALRLTGGKVTTIHDVAVASADGSLLEETTLSGTSHTFENLAPGTRYYARVNADDGEWSSVVDFATAQASGTAPAWSALPAQTVAVGADCDLDLAAYVSGTAPIAISMAETEYDAVLVGTAFSFTPDAVGTFTFSFTAANDFGSSQATLTVTATGSAPVVTVTPATYAYNVTVGDPDVEFTVTASGNPAPVLSGSCTEGAFYVFENNAFLFEPDTAGTYHFVFTATNGEGSDSKTVTVTVSAPAVTVPVLSIDNETSTTADASWTAVTGATAYTLQLASDPNFTVGGTGQTLTLFDNPATTPGTAPIGWTYYIKNDSGDYLQLTTTNHFVLTDTFDTSACATMTLTLKARTYNGTAEGTTNLLVQYTTDNGTTWHDIGTVSASTTSLANKELNASAAIGHSSVRFRFSVPGAASGKGLGISTLLLTGKETSAAGSLIGEYTVSGTNYTFTDLSPDTFYYARVKADGGEWSNIVEFLTDEGGSPSSDPAELVIADPYSGQFQVLNFSSNLYYYLLYTTDLRKPLEEYETLYLGQGPSSGEFWHAFPDVDGDWFGGLLVTPTAP